MVEISQSGSGEGPGWATAPGYSTAAFSLAVPAGGLAARWKSRLFDRHYIVLVLGSSER